MSRCSPAARKKSSSACPPNWPRSPEGLHPRARQQDGVQEKSKRSKSMEIPFHREMRIGAYILKQKLAGRKRYPLVLMLEPLFRCNLACTGCGKIDYPHAILN